MNQSQDVKRMIFIVRTYRFFTAFWKYAYIVMQELPGIAKKKLLVKML